MSEIFVKSFTHLKDRPKEDEALRQLQRVASLVKPIMRKHGWVLPVLSEFFPESPNLLGLNVNAGQKILIRLRPATAPDTFYPEEDVMHTMLHELTHNVHGPHDETFYKYLAGLEDELDALKRSGYAGEGFHSRGKRLGTNVSHNLPPHLARLKALEAAEKRLKVNSVSVGARRLGGAGEQKQKLTPRELAVQAALRRAGDDTACGSSEIAEKEAAKATKEGIESQVIDLTLDSDSDSDIVVSAPTPPTAGPSKIGVRKRPPTSTIVSSKSQKTQSAPVARHKPSSVRKQTTRSGVDEPKPWTCDICTLINDTFALRCVACDSNPPRDPASGWVCLDCGTENELKWWMCNLCGAIKTES